MRQTRIYTPQSLCVADTIELTGSTSHYLARVLRASRGDSIKVFNGDGQEFSGQVVDVQRQCVTVRLLNSRVPAMESPLRVTLVQAISRGERMDYSLQKATELGVSCIQPVSSQRVEVHMDEKRQAKRMTHWRAVMTSACEQSGRAVLPELKSPCCVDDWLIAQDPSRRLVLDPGATLKLSSLQITSNEVSVLVGPEGGLSGEELDRVKAAGVTPVSLGARILRTETAGPVAIAVLQACSGDL